MRRAATIGDSAARAGPRATTPLTGTSAASGSPSQRAGARPRVGRRLATAALLAALGVSVLLAVPGLRPVVREIGAISPTWAIAAVALELASCASFVVLFRLFFDRVPAGDSRSLAWTSMGSGALLPGGGVGGLAVGGWLIHLTGASTSWIVRRSGGLFFLTTAVNSAVVIGAALLLLGAYPGPHAFPRAALPLLLAAIATAAVVSLPWAARRRTRVPAPWLGGILAGIREAERTAAHPSWRLLGALGYLGFDIAVLWATFSAVGHVPPVPALVLGYMIGYLAGALPIPGGLGVLDAGLTGALVLYGASPAPAAAAVLVYHAIAFWVPALGGVAAYAYLRPRLIDRASPGAAPLPRESIPTSKGDPHAHLDRSSRRSHPGSLSSHRTQRAGTVLSGGWSGPRRHGCARPARASAEASETPAGIRAGDRRRAP
jgi:uncharacterized membrane protein YbhN (UPF0104 family)